MRGLLAAAVDSGRAYGEPGWVFAVMVIVLVVGVAVLIATRPGR